MNTPQNTYDPIRAQDAMIAAVRAAPDETKLALVKAHPDLAGKAAVAFSMHPVTIEDLMAISDEGGIMPPKSTWFEPKLRDGLLIHTI